MRRFVLVRDHDTPEVPGEGVVVWGIQWPDGHVAYRWHSPHSTSSTAGDLATVLAVHGRNGATRLEWLDGPDDGDDWQLYQINDLPWKTRP